MKSCLGWLLYSVRSLALIVLLAGCAAAQEGVVGTVKFYPTGMQHNTLLQSNSLIELGGHAMSCAQDPIWRHDQIKGKTTTNMDLFGPCTIDGVFVHHIVLYESKSGILMVLDMMDGTSWSLMLVNSATVHVLDLMDVGYRGHYAAPKYVGFALFGQHEATWR